MNFEDVVRVGAEALMKEWFPKGHGGDVDDRLAEDFENWTTNALLDSEVVVRAIAEAGLLSVSDGAMVDPMTKDERST